MTAQEMVLDLLNSGYTTFALATEVETSQPNIQRISAGQEPRYGLGKRIECLHRATKRKSHLKQA